MELFHAFLSQICGAADAKYFDLSRFQLTVDSPRVWRVKGLKRPHRRMDSRSGLAADESGA